MTLNNKYLGIMYYFSIQYIKSLISCFENDAMYITFQFNFLIIEKYSI